MDSDPLLLPPALPAELLHYIIHQCAFPTTLVICSTRGGFLFSLAQNIRDEQQRDQTQQNIQTPPETAPTTATELLSAPLYQVAVARHIRIVFIPTVSHLRAFLSVFSVQDSKVSAPPATPPGLPVSGKRPLFLIYGFLDMHRGTSEWSAQGLSNTAAVFVETARRVGFRAVAAEPRVAHEEGRQIGMAGLLTEMIPILSGGGGRRTGPDLDGSGWAGRTVDVQRVLGRWFRFQPGDWESINSRSLDP
ncbi:hypothetical protein B0T22DRAFT_139059 [Podospora appendiculata]|uniref:Uncharacterized protein n=1 Tax=Podospora appendiculata TaxID=314037 RepID=A0AAE1CBU2_9PEZI|nr:hypothetical protein B0T22DRAFT_139059 [Podospora appendiculata]